MLTAKLAKNPERNTRFNHGVLCVQNLAFLAKRGRSPGADYYDEAMQPEIVFKIQPFNPSTKTRESAIFTL